MRRDLFHFENDACPECRALRLHTLEELCEHHTIGTGFNPGEDSQAAAPADDERTVQHGRQQI